ncbi:MAG: hypothetical protein KDA32_11100 [Phycisphaerales bacterium]|nr:hypothetical protein [Phycisphaerales bacterium]
MFGKLRQLIGIVAVSTLLASGGFVGWLYYTGKLTPERLDTIAAVLRGEHDESTEIEPEQAPEETTEPARAMSAEEVRQMRLRQRELRARADRELRNVEAQRELLESARADLMSAEERFADSKKDWLETQKKLSQETEDAGFKQQVATVERLSAKQGKSFVESQWARNRPETLRLLTALKPSKRAEILAQFKDPSDADTLNQILVSLGDPDVVASKPTPGTASARRP